MEDGKSRGKSRHSAPTGLHWSSLAVIRLKSRLESSREEELTIPAPDELFSVTILIQFQTLPISLFLSLSLLIQENYAGSDSRLSITINDFRLTLSDALSDIHPPDQVEDPQTSRTNARTHTHTGLDQLLCKCKASLCQKHKHIR